MDKQLAILMHLIETKYLSRPSISDEEKPSKSVAVDFSRIFHFLALDVISELSFSGAFGFLQKDEDLYHCIEINEGGLRFSEMDCGLVLYVEGDVEVAFQSIRPK